MMLVVGCGCHLLGELGLDRNVASHVRSKWCSCDGFRADAFELDRRETPDGGVTPGRVVPGFDPFEDRLGELATRRPLATVEELELQRGEKALEHMGVRA